MRGRNATALMLAVLALAGCGGDETTGAEDTTRQTTTVETPGTTTDQVTTETAPTGTTPARETPRQILIVVDQGRPRGGIKRPIVEQGSKLVLVVRADVGEAIHVHGYDVEKRVTPGKPVRIPINATLPGRFEVELHHPDALLAVLEVRP